MSSVLTVMSSVTTIVLSLLTVIPSYVETSFFGYACGSLHTLPSVEMAELQFGRDQLAA